MELEAAYNLIFGTKEDEDNIFSNTSNDDIIEPNQPESKITMACDAPVTVDFTGMAFPSDPIIPLGSLMQILD